MTNEFANSLQDFLMAEDEAAFLDNAALENAQTEQAQKELIEHYKIKDDAQANYFIKKYLEIVEQENKIRKTAQEEIDRVTHNCKNWAETEITKLSYSKEFFRTQLKEYAKTQLQDSKKKKLSLPEGVMSFRKAPVNYDYDEVQMINYLKAHHSKLLNETIDYAIDKRAIKKEFQLNDEKQVVLEGEIVDFVHATQKEDEFTIK